MATATPTLLVWTGPAPEPGAAVGAAGASAGVSGGVPAADPAQAVTTLAGLLAALRQTLPGWYVQPLQAPWQDWRPLQDRLHGASGLPVVVVAPARRVPLGRVWDLAGAAGLDPARGQVVDLWSRHGTDPWVAMTAPGWTAHAVRRLTAAAARVTAAVSTPPAGVRLRVATVRVRTARGRLATALETHYEPVPWIRSQVCLAARGCDLCATRCPAGAIRCAGHTAVLDGDACTSCGLCLAACPTGAIVHPAVPPEAVSAEVDSWVSVGSPPGIVAFACPAAMAVLAAAGAGGQALPPGVLPVPVPCAAALPVHQLLHPLEQGAAAVAVVGCSARCRYGVGADRLAEPVTWAAQWLAQIGGNPRAVAMIPAEAGDAGPTVAALHRLAVEVGSTRGGPLPLPSATARTPTGADLLPAGPATAAATLIGGLLQRHPGQGWMPTATLPLGRVTVHANECTMCGLCAAACPPGALFLTDGDTVQLHVHTGDCTACTACMRACPEDAIRVEREVDLAEIRRGVRTLVATEVLRCKRCGQPTGSTALSAAIRARLTRSNAGVSLSYLEYCPMCRKAAMVAPRHDGSRCDGGLPA